MIFLIISLNFILLFGSLVLTIFGILFHVGVDVNIVETLELTTKKNIRDLITTTGIGDVDNIDKFSFIDLLGGWIADVMIGVGIGFSTLSFSGCCGAWYKVRCLLLVYILLLIFILFMEALLLPLAFAAPITIQGQIKRMLYFTLEDFTGLAGSNTDTLGWMFVMNYYGCCGIETFVDFKDNSASWDRTPGDITTAIDAPLICCKTAITGGADGNVDCARDGVTKDIYPEGCFDIIWNKVLSNSMYTYLTIGNVVLLQIILIICSIKFYRDAKEKRKVYPDQFSTKKLKK